MKTLIVSRNVWAKCFYLQYELFEQLGPAKVKESLAEEYGIEHWEKINLDEFKITFTDDEKMTFWILRWT